MANWGGIQICPYYISQTKYRIMCESIAADDSHRISLEFETSDNKKKWLKKHCESWKYKECPYAEMIANKYGEETRDADISEKTEKGAEKGKKLGERT